MVGWLNVGSLLLGIAAWLLPVVYLVRGRRGAALPALSFGACGGALYLQIVQTGLLVDAPWGWATIEDTAQGVSTAATALVAVTVLMNLLAALGGCWFAARGRAAGSASNATEL